jgi:lysozyme
MKLWIHKIGCKGQEVKRIQSAINMSLIDGDFGPKTHAAVEQFQLDNKLSVDGRVGPQTRCALEVDIYPGIDVSRWQGNIDWPKLKASGLAKFCWAKITEGNNYQDPMFKQHILGAKSTGILVGGYHFARPDLHADPYKEVKNFVKHCPIEVGQLRPVMDFERAGTLDPDSLHRWVVEFLKELEAQSGVRPIIYTGGNMVKYGLRNNTSTLDTYTLWHAYYSKKAFKKGIKPKRLGSWKEWRVWQWTGSGELDGVPGPIDRNWLVGGPSGLSEILVT